MDPAQVGRFDSGFCRGSASRPSAPAALCGSSLRSWRRPRSPPCRRSGSPAEVFFGPEVGGVRLLCEFFFFFFSNTNVLLGGPYPETARIEPEAGGWWVVVVVGGGGGRWVVVVVGSPYRESDTTY